MHCHDQIQENFTTFFSVTELKYDSLRLRYHPVVARYQQSTGVDIEGVALSSKPVAQSQGDGKRAAMDWAPFRTLCTQSGRP